MNRWARVGLLALAVFVINVISRWVTWQFEITDADDQTTVAVIGLGSLALMLGVATAWWAYRYPFTRIFADFGAAVGVGTLLSLVIGPFAGGEVPFAEGLGAFVGEILMFVGVGAVGVVLGFLAMVTVGKDWKSRGLRRFETRINRKLHGTPH